MSDFVFELLMIRPSNITNFFLIRESKQNFFDKINISYIFLKSNDLFMSFEIQKVANRSSS